MSDSKSRKRKHPTDDDCMTSFLFKIKARSVVTLSKSTHVVLSGVEIQKINLENVQQSSKSSTHLNKLIKDPVPSLSIYGKTIHKEFLRKFAKLDFDSRIERCATVNVVVKSDIVQELNSLTLDEVEDENCAICLETLDLTNAVTLPCCHDYHRRCLFRWLRKEEDCPLCRRPLADKPRL